MKNVNPVPELNFLGAVRVLPELLTLRVSHLLHGVRAETGWAS